MTIRLDLGGFALTTFLAITASAMPPPDAAAAASQERQPVYQLRIYEIFEGNEAAFHERFRDHATRIMGRDGFRILAMWESGSDERTEFVYLLEWPDERKI